MDDIYSRVSELIAEEKEKITMREVFESPTYAAFLRKKAQNIISGTFYELRNMGFCASQAEEDRLLENLRVEVVYKPEEKDFTAYAEDYGRNHGQLVCLNAGHDLVTEQTSRERKHLALLGFLYHEIGHILFTDYPTCRAWKYRLKEGRWFPQEPKEFNTVTGINLAQNMQDADFLNVMVQCADVIDNCIEDGFIEREVCGICPGMGKDALATLNDEFFERAQELKNRDPDDPEAKKPGYEFFAILRQVLLYSKFDEIKIAEDYNEALGGPIYECIEIVDKCKYERDPQKRIAGTNSILCILSPYIDKAIAEQMQENKESSPQQNNNQQGTQSGAGNASGNGGAGSSQGQGGGKGNAAGQIGQKIQQLKKQVGASSQNPNNTSSAVNNPGENGNQNAPSSQIAQGSAPKGPGSMGDGNLEAAAKETENLINSIATSKAKKQAEKERTADLNNESKEVDYSAFGLPSNTQIQVSRAASVPDSNIEAYTKVAPEIQNVSRGLQRDIKRLLKDRREGGKRKNLPFGRRLEVTSIVHNDAKYFSRNKMPTETPRLGVGLLVDESGSTAGDLINAATIASLVVEDFCRELDIPHLIYGYTSRRGSTNLISYAEPHEIDSGNRYRITGMDARGGTPTATALTYMANRIMKLPADIRLLIVISDGGSGDNVKTSDGEYVIKKMIRYLQKRKVIVVAAGIGDDRREVKKEFGDNFMDISDIDMMPEQLILLIKQNLVV